VRPPSTTGDRVASFAANNAEMQIALVSSAAVGPVYSCSPVEFGVKAVVDRFTQVRPYFELGGRFPAFLTHSARRN
jgi:acyl-coenzyme A synthetase/AMP-(fatty) acid ligase